MGLPFRRPRVALLIGAQTAALLCRVARLHRVVRLLLVFALPGVLGQILVVVALGLHRLDPVPLHRLDPAPIGLLPSLVASPLLVTTRSAAARANRLQPPQCPVAWRGSVVVGGLDPQAAHAWAERDAGLGVTVRHTGTAGYGRR